uniref:Uncharacterized protein n=1 Tax=Amphimedon queenslandica TaxID=400682 RepID=A0A1X7TH45_AMPQE
MALILLSLALLFLSVQGHLQDYEIVQCYSSTYNCVSNTNGVSLPAIDCCGRTGGGYARHSSFTGIWQSALCSPLCIVIGFDQSLLHFVSRDAGRVASLTADELYRTPGASLLSIKNNVSINIETRSLPDNIDDYFVSFMKQATINSTELPFTVQLEVTRGNGIALQPSISFSYVMSLNPDSKLPPGVAVVFKSARILAEDVDVMTTRLRVWPLLVEGFTGQAHIRRKKINFESPFQVTLVFDNYSGILSPFYNSVGNISFPNKQMVVFDPYKDQSIISKPVSFIIPIDNIVEFSQVFLIRMSVNDSRVKITSVTTHPV